MKGIEMALLRRRLAAAGYQIKVFRYASRQGTLPDNARHLNDFLHTIDTETRHLVAHSLGGLLVRQLLDAFPVQRPGRVVTLGTPHAGSRVARTMAGMPGVKWLLGRSGEPLCGKVPAWSATHELGSLAGDRPMGVGWLVPGLPRPNDGTVAVAETRLAGMADHRVIHASHFGLLFSREVAEQTVCFLRTGRFSH